MPDIRECDSAFRLQMSEARGLLKSMMVICSAQAVNILISILRMKVLALLLGPTGVGLLSIHNSLQGMVSTAAGLGMGSSCVRQIASVMGEEQAFSRVRRVLFDANLVQGTIAMLGVWLLRAPIAEWLFGLPVVLLKIGPRGRLASRLSRFYPDIGLPIRSTE